MGQVWSIFYVQFSRNEPYNLVYPINIIITVKPYAFVKISKKYKLFLYNEAPLKLFYTHRTSKFGFYDPLSSFLPVGEGWMPNSEVRWVMSIYINKQSKDLGGFVESTCYIYFFLLFLSVW